ncbi:MAG: SpoIIE family protein phosphatase [Chloroflexota bacterium]|nr:SpoIIE family protein phosphatase [Chloroflexota bacterium]
MVVKPPYKILVVDDEPDLEPLMLQRMRRNIRRGQYTFVFARNGIEALDRLHDEDDIDMVVSDINMPEMDGLTLLQQIPKVDPNIRSIIVSAYGDMENIRTAMNRGAFDFVTKPIDFRDLRLTIDRTLQHLMEWREALASRDQLVALQNELSVASKMQQSILPTHFPASPHYQVFANMEPARSVGGDFFDIVMLENERIGMTVADVSDKGVPAALFMMSTRTLIKGAAIGSAGPGDVLREVNNLLYEDNETEMFVTVLYAEYNPVSGEFVYASGGHDPPLLVKPDGSSSTLDLTGGIALGLLPDLDYRQNSVILEPGDTIVLYTDGVSEAMTRDEEQFGLERLRAAVAADTGDDAEAANEAVFDAVSEFVGDNPASDDITCLTFRRTERG